MKIKDLPPDKPLGGVRFRYPGNGKIYYWASQWAQGVWGKKRMEDRKIHPLPCNPLSEAEEWEVVPDEVPRGRKTS